MQTNCDAKALLLYVVDTNNTLSIFNTNSSTFVDIGTLNCPAGLGATPFSMGVARNGYAWVLYSDGAIFKVNPLDASCVATPYVPGQHGEELFGMGFVAPAGASEDWLFIAGGSALSVGSGDKMLGILDTNTLQVATIGAVHGSPELTGTGDGELWGFYPGTTPPRVSQIDQNTGSDLTTYNLTQLQDFSTPRSWAFAFWGGKFWMFLRKASESSTSVYSLDRQGGANFTTVLSNTGRTIVGAGVSTCAPLVN